MLNVQIDCRRTKAKQLFETLKKAKLSNKTTSKKDWRTVTGNVCATAQQEIERGKREKGETTVKKVGTGGYIYKHSVNWLQSQLRIQGEL